MVKFQSKKNKDFFLLKNGGFMKIILFLFSLFILTYSQNSYAGNCDYSWQEDSAGRKCGKRAASQREGGYEPPYHPRGY